MKRMTLLLSLALALSITTGSRAQEPESKSGDRPPELVSKVEAVYPQSMRRYGITGRAVVQYVITKDGTVGEAVAVEATRSPFGKAAVKAVKQWVYRPGIKGGEPVNVRVQVTIAFDLN